MPEFDAITGADLILGLKVAIGVMVLVVLYHALFIVVDLRKITRRVQDVSEELEEVIMKPISMADQILAWVIEMIESTAHKRKAKKVAKKHD